MSTPDNKQSSAPTPPPRPAPPKKGLAAVYDFLMQSYCWFAIFFLVYVLSAGPLFTPWQRAVETGTNPLLQIFYMPLSAMCEQSETLKTVLDWYVGLWS